MNEQKTLIAQIKERVIALIERFKHEPVLVRSALMLLAGAGIIEISGAQMDKIEAIALVILFLLGSNSIRRNVTPTCDLEQDYEESNSPQSNQADQGGQE
jgi:hypothetical protein